jgi:hypothetical protein
VFAAPQGRSSLENADPFLAANKPGSRREPGNYPINAGIKKDKSFQDLLKKPELREAKNGLYPGFAT